MTTFYIVYKAFAFPEREIPLLFFFSGNYLLGIKKFVQTKTFCGDSLVLPFG